jgi:hypothetical protein
MRCFCCGEKVCIGKSKRRPETLTERRIRQRDESCERIRRITDRGGIAGIALPEGFY